MRFKVEVTFLEVIFGLVFKLNWKIEGENLEKVS